MGKKSSTRNLGSQPQVRKKQRSLIGVLIRVIGAVVLVGALFFLVAGFYYSGEIRDGGLVPADSYDNTYDLVISSVSGDRLSISDSGSDDQIGEPGIEGVEWASGYVLTTELVSSGATEEGSRTDVRLLEADGTAPSVGTAVRLDPFSYAGDPMQAFGIPFETVSYSSDIGSFPAWLIPGNSETWAIVVHGKGADLNESLRIVPILKALDFPIMIIRYRNDPGEARDPSGYYQYGATEWVDLAAAVRYAEQNGSTSHVLVGFSMGGAIVTSFLTQSPLRNRTRAAILDSPVFSFEAVVDFQAMNTQLPLIGTSIPESLTGFAKRIAGWRFDIDWDASNYLAQSNELHVPMLIFHGTGDTSVPIATSQQMANLRPDIVTLVTTEANHVRSWNESPDTYEETIIEFLAGLS